MHSYLTRRRDFGFTLLEVLIAISIFSIIGLGSYHTLKLVISSEATAVIHSQTLSRLQRAMLLLGNDLEQVVDRPVRDGRSEWTGALIADHGTYLLEFTRQGWRNPLHLPRSDLQRVAYMLQHIPDPTAPGGYTASLLRYHWQVRERAEDSLPQSLVLLENIRDVRFRFLDREGVWHSVWPQDVTKALPCAIEVDIETTSAGMLRRVFQTGAS